MSNLFELVRRVRAVGVTVIATGLVVASAALTPLIPLQTSTYSQSELNLAKPPLIQSLKQIVTQEPAYTDEALRARIEGTVIIFAEVEATGFPKTLRVLRSLGYGLDEQAIEAVRSSQFEFPPDTGQLADVATLIPVTFRLPPGLRSASNGRGELFRAGSGIPPPRLVRRVVPTYTEEARAAKFGGSLVIYLEVTEEGNVQNVQVLRPLGMGLDEEAAAAVGQWKFQPPFEELWTGCNISDDRDQLRSQIV